jgi:hypothetical protein
LTKSVPLGTYDRLFAEQNGKCANCRTDKPGGNGKRFHLDHDHETGRIRGLLCTNCNTGIGQFKDDADLLKAAIEYLAKHNLSSTTRA